MTRGLKAVASLLAAGAAWVICGCGGSEPAVRTPDHHPYFGYNEFRWIQDGEVGWQDQGGPDPDARMQAAVEATADGGADSDVLPIVWADVLNNGWSRYQDLYDAMTDRGIAPVVRLLGTPTEWRPVNCAEQIWAPPDPSHYADWKAFVADAAARFPEALAWEVWNEPNSPDFWGGPGCPQSTDEREAAYVDLVRLAREAMGPAQLIKPYRFIITAGLNPASSEDVIPWTSFLGAIQDLGVLDYASGIGLHPYPNTADCETEPQEPLPRRLAGGMLDQVTEARGLTGASIWVTEFGASSAGGASADCRSLDEEGQAQALTGMYRALADRSDYVRVAIVQQLVDEQPPTTTDPFYGAFGVSTSIDSLGDKPAYACLAALRGRRSLDPSCNY